MTTEQQRAREKLERALQYRPNGPGRCQCAKCGGGLSTNAWAKASHEKRCPGRPGLVYFGDFPAYFTSDSMERGIFKPETDSHATPAQLQALLADAKFYADPDGPDQCPPGLIASARAIVKRLTGNRR